MNLKLYFSRWLVGSRTRMYGLNSINRRPLTFWSTSSGCMIVKLAIITSRKRIIQICWNVYYWVSKIAFYSRNPRCCCCCCCCRRGGGLPLELSFRWKSNIVKCLNIFGTWWNHFLSPLPQVLQVLPIQPSTTLAKIEWMFTLFVTDVTPLVVRSMIIYFGVNIEWTGRWVVHFHSTYWS